MNNYTDQGFDENLTRSENKTKPLRKDEIDRMFPQLPGDKLDQYISKTMKFIPTKPSANPSEGEVYYDKELKKLRIFTGTEYEEISSA